MEGVWKRRWVCGTLGGGRVGWRGGSVAGDLVDVVVAGCALFLDKKRCKKKTQKICQNSKKFHLASWTLLAVAAHNLTVL